jgi:hypothetical protein
MSLRRNRPFERLGPAEFVGVALLILAAASATSWWQRSGRVSFARADGRVVEGRVAWTHYNSTDLREKVSVTYQYAVGSDSFTGTWTGFWPEDDSPNALPADRLREACEKDHPLVVSYDPASPSISYLHPAEGGGERLLRGIAVGSCVLALIYCVALYPAWRRA